MAGAVAVLGAVALCCPAGAAAVGLPYGQQPGSPIATGSGPSAVAFSPSGGLVATADYIGGDVSVFSYNASSGTLAPVSGSPFQAGVGPDSVAFSPNGQLLAVANLVDDTVSIFSVTGSGTLAQVAGSPFATGMDPRAVAFNPAGSLLAVANAADNTVSLFGVDATTGALHAGNGSPFGTGADPLSLQFSPDGKFLAVADHNDSSVSIFSVDAGQLSPLGGTPIATGLGPSSLAFSPNGALLATANTDANTVSVFAFDRTTGGTQPIAGSPYATDASPIAVGFSASGGLLATADLAAGDVSLFVVAPSAGGLAPESGSPFRTGNQPHGLAFPHLGNDFVVVNRADGTISVMGPAPPTATITEPPPGGEYKWHQRVRTAFSCAEVSGGPGIRSCRDSHGRDRGSGTLYTASGGTFTYSVTAVSVDGLSSTTSLTYTVVGPPTQLAPPVISGTSQVGQRLTCSNASWTGRPTSFSHLWSRNGVPIHGATNPTYKVQVLDEGSALACAALARNKYGDVHGSPSRDVRVAVPGVRGCPAASGGLVGADLGPVRLGEARANVRRTFRASKLTSGAYVDAFCMTPTGTRVGYPAPEILTALRRSRNGHIGGRAVWIATKNPRYVVDGTAVGSTLKDVQTRLPHGSLVRVRQDLVWLVPAGANTLLFDSSGGNIVQVGVAKSAMLRNPGTRLLLLRSVV
jgi:6-phosphogluconolactonase (cycloisomerase 2 family)